MSKPWAGVLIHIWQLCVTEAPNFVPPLTIVSHNGLLWFIFGIRRNVGVKMLYTLTSGFIFIHLRVGTLYILLFCLCIGKVSQEARSRSKTQVSRGRARSLSPEIVASRPILCGNYSLFSLPSLCCAAPHVVRVYCLVLLWLQLRPGAVKLKVTLLCSVEVNFMTTSPPPPAPRRVVLCCAKLSCDVWKLKYAVLAWGGVSI